VFIHLPRNFLLFVALFSDTVIGSDCSNEWYDNSLIMNWNKLRKGMLLAYLRWHSGISLERLRNTSENLVGLAWEQRFELLTSGTQCKSATFSIAKSAVLLKHELSVVLITKAHRWTLLWTYPFSVTLKQLISMLNNLNLTCSPTTAVF